jgi:hypothetical protein
MVTTYGFGVMIGRFTFISITEVDRPNVSLKTILMFGIVHGMLEVSMKTGSERENNKDGFILNQVKILRIGELKKITMIMELMMVLTMVDTTWFSLRSSKADCLIEKKKKKIISSYI